METTLGIRGPDFVMLAADCSMQRSIIMMGNDDNKIHRISENVMVASTGENGDRIQFTEFIAKNIALYKMRNGYDLNPTSVAHYTRRNLAEYLRSRSAYNVNMLLGGYDPKTGPCLYYIDYLGNAKPMKCSSHGYGGILSGSIFDRFYTPNITQDQAYDVMKKCLMEIHKRFVVNQLKFNVAVVDKNGVRFLPQLNIVDLVKA